jgi:hypothetical protein
MSDKTEKKKTPHVEHWWHVLAIPPLLFLSAVMSWTLLKIAPDMSLTAALTPLAIGFGAGMLCFTLLFRLEDFYVFGHELTHWFFAKLFLRQTCGISRIKVKENGGCVLIENPNFWIILAPYFVPFYLLLWCAAYGVWRLAIGNAFPEIAEPVFFGGFGLFYAYHVVMTLWALFDGQKDLQDCGPTFSISLIIFMNLVALYVTIVACNGRWERDLQITWQILIIQASWLDQVLTDACSQLWRFIDVNILKSGNG